MNADSPPCYVRTVTRFEQLNFEVTAVATAEPSNTGRLMTVFKILSRS